MFSGANKMIKSILSLILCLIALPVFAGVHWVSSSGSSTWATCLSATDPGSGYCSLATGLSTAVFGDTVYLKGGTYSYASIYNSAFAPAHSGSAGNVITFSAAPGETPVIQQGDTTNIMIGIDLNGVSYIKITGIIFKNFMYYYAFLRGGASHNEISYCTITSDASYQAGTGFIIGGFDGTSGWSTHNWLHHNYISSKHNTDPCGEATDLIRVGNAESGPTSADNYNTIENNYLEYGGHSTIMTNSKYNVLKNNISHNEPWITGCTSTSSCSGYTWCNYPIYTTTSYNGLFGHRNFGIGDSDQANAAYTLLEGNRLGFASTNPGNAGSSNIDLESPYNIVRYNYVFAGMDSGIYFKWANSAGTGTGAVYNKVFNNTIYKNGYGWDSRTYGHGNWTYNGQGIAQYSANGSATNNVVKNNIVYGHTEGDICALGLYTPPGNCTVQNWDTATNNWVTATGDPKFVNTDISDPTSQNLISTAHGYTTTPTPNLFLQSSSGAIDGGTYLTTATVSGTASTTLVVADAMYFQDGTWGSSLARGTTHFADWIAIGTVSNVVQISSINYSTNTITLASPMTWNNGADIWLYKKSDGSTVLVGSAPDYGAYEYTSGGGAPSSHGSCTGCAGHGAVPTGY